MGTNYSQPPLGFQYSTQQFEPKTDLMEVHKSFDCFYDLYMNNYENEKNLIYMLNESNDNKIVNYTYENCFRMCQSIQQFLTQNNIKENASIAVYAECQFETQVFCNAALLFGYHLIVSSPSSIVNVSRFVEKVQKYSPSVVFCSSKHSKDLNNKMSNVLIITYGNSNQNSFSRIISSKASYNNENHHLVDGPCLTILENDKEPVDLSNEDILIFLSEWAEKLKICRDAVIAVYYDCSENISRIVNLLCVYCRSKICFPSSEEKIHDFNPTHLFASPNFFKNEITKKKNTDKSTLFGLKFSIFYPYKRIRIIMGAQTSFADKQVFNSLQSNYGSELHYIFSSGIIEKSIHEEWMVYYNKPLSIIYMPAKWGNVGTSLPCEVRYIKLGTVGGPILDSVYIDPETKHIVNRVTGMQFDECGFFDEEGSLVVQ